MPEMVLATRIHPTAMIEANVAIGVGTSIWDNVHIRHDSAIGDECIIGEKTHIAYGVTIGNRCKINAFVYICTGVTLADGVMVAAGTIFTNDRFPRATSADLQTLRCSDPDEFTLRTHVHEGATIGARGVIGCGLTIGRWAMIGMGAVVTKSVPDFALAVGHPARVVGTVCRCGELLQRFDSSMIPTPRTLICGDCERQYDFNDGQVLERNSR